MRERVSGKKVWGRLRGEKPESLSRAKGALIVREDGQGVQGTPGPKQGQEKKGDLAGQGSLPDLERPSALGSGKVLRKRARSVYSLHH